MRFLSTDLMTYIARLIVIFAILPIHECAHAYVSYKLGDPTAKRQGRLTINPLVHIDIMGAVCLMLAGFGWAKPVPVNPSYYKNKKLGMAITALAGPLANFLMSVVVMALAKTASLTYYLFFMQPALFTIAQALNLMAVISLSLAVFNLLPVPPLDGSRILLIILPTNLYFKIMRYEQYISYALFGLLFLGFLDGPLSFLIGNMLVVVDWLTGFVPWLFGLAVG